MGVTMAQEQQSQRSVDTETSNTTREKYFKIIAPYQKSADYRLSDAERGELLQQLSGLLIRGRYRDATSGQLVYLIRISSPQGGRAIDSYVSYQLMNGTKQMNSLEFFITLHKFCYVDAASL